MKQKSSIIERFKIAWYALTLKNYIYVGLKEEPALFDNDGNYIGVAKGSIKSYSYVDDTVRYTVDKEKCGKDKASLYDIVWLTMIEISKKNLDNYGTTNNEKCQ